MNMKYVEEKGSIRNQLFSILTMHIITFNQGNAIGWVSPALSVFSGPDSPLDKPLTISQESLMASIYCIGSIFGTLAYGPILDSYGRKTVAMTTALPFAICWSLKLFWMNPYAIIIGRFIAGFGGAGMLCVSPIYCTEVCSAEYRGALGTLVSITFNLGILVMYILGEYLPYKTVLTVMLSCPILFMILITKIPESPSTLAKCGRFEEAAEAIGWLRQLPVDSVTVQNEIDKLKYEIKILQESHKKENQEKEVSAIKFLISSPFSLRTLLVTVTLMGLQSLSGIFAILSYASEIFSDAGSTLTPGMSSILIGLLQLLGSGVAISFIERQGRKTLLLSSMVIVSLSMVVMGFYMFAKDSGYNVRSYGIVPVITLSVVVFAFSIGFGPIPFILPSEMFVMRIRGLAASISLVTMWLASFIVAQFFKSVAEYFGNATVFWSFAVIGCLAIVLVIFFLPETKGVSLEDIVFYFGGPRHISKSNDEDLGIPLKDKVKNKNTNDAV